MAYKITLEARMAPTTVDVDVPDEVANDLAQTYKALAETPKVLAHAVFDDEAQKNEFIAQAKTWARNQTPRLEFRVSPMRKGRFPSNELRFNIRAESVEDQKSNEPRAEQR